MSLLLCIYWGTDHVGFMLRFFEGWVWGFSVRVMRQDAKKITPGLSDFFLGGGVPPCACIQVYQQPIRMAMGRLPRGETEGRAYLKSRELCVGT